MYKALKMELAKVLEELQRIKGGEEVPKDLLDVIKQITVTMKGMKDGQ